MLNDVLVPVFSLNRYKSTKIDFWMFNGCLKKFCRGFCIRLSGQILGVKLNLHLYKTVKDFKTSSLDDIAAANVCAMKKTRGLYHVSERRSGRFSEIEVILTAPAVQYVRVCIAMFTDQNESLINGQK
jgi:hypothetical protein